MDLTLRPAIHNWWIDEDHGALHLTVRWDLPGVHTVRYARGKTTSIDGRPALKHRNQREVRSLLPEHTGFNWFTVVGDNVALIGPDLPILEALVLLEDDLRLIAHRFDITATEETDAIAETWNPTETVEEPEPPADPPYEIVSMDGTVLISSPSIGIYDVELEDDEGEVG